MRMCLALAAMVWLTTVADAQEDSLRKALIRGRPKTATMALRRVSKRPDTVYAVARLAADMAFKLSSQDWEDAIEFADALVAHADTTSTDDGLALYALAEAHIVRARVVRAALSTLRGTRLPEDSPLGALQENDAVSTSYKKATELLLKSYAARQQEGDALARAVGIVAERAQADPDTAAELLTQAADLAETVIKHNAISERAAYAEATVALMRARHELPTAKSKEVKAIREEIEQAVNHLRPPENARTEDIEYPTKYNEMVTFIKENKKNLPLKKVEYVTDRGSAIGSLDYRIPRSRFWSKGSPIKHWNADGVLLRMITFDDYRFETEYTVGVKGIGGDNAKGLCSHGISSSRELFVKIKRERKAVKGRINRKIKANAYYFHIGGYDEHDLFLQVRGYYFKNMKTRRTQHVLFVEWVDSKKLDPEGKNFVDSLQQR